MEHEPNGDTPIWIRVLYRYGVPAAIALFLTYFLTHDVKADVNAVKADVSAMRTEHQELRFYLRAICINAAQTEVDMARCVPTNEAR